MAGAVAPGRPGGGDDHRHRAASRGVGNLPTFAGADHAVAGAPRRDRVRGAERHAARADALAAGPAADARPDAARPGAQPGAAGRQLPALRPLPRNGAHQPAGQLRRLLGRTRQESAQQYEKAARPAAQGGRREPARPQPRARTDGRRRGRFRPARKRRLEGRGRHRYPSGQRAGPLLPQHARRHGAAGRRRRLPLLVRRAPGGDEAVRRKRRQHRDPEDHLRRNPGRPLYAGLPAARGAVPGRVCGGPPGAARILRQGDGLATRLPAPSGGRRIHHGVTPHVPGIRQIHPRRGPRPGRRGRRADRPIGPDGQHPRTRLDGCGTADRRARRTLRLRHRRRRTQRQHLRHRRESGRVRRTQAGRMDAGAAAPPPSALPFFLAAAGGRRYCLYHPAAGDCHGALVYVPPFGEEMHKARRMAALQARALARQGVAVLQIDLYGCGDSGGDFSAARWAIWRDDVGLACDWLAERSGHRPGLLGLRLGALLALDYAASAATAPPHLLLWQPVADGASFLTQFLRLRTAGAMLEGGDGAERNGTQALRARLRAGETLEIGGYELAPELAAAIDGLKLETLAGAAAAPHCFDIGAAGRAPPPVLARIIQAWRARGLQPTLTLVDGPPFWASQEITTCPDLLEPTLALMSMAADAI